MDTNEYPTGVRISDAHNKAVPMQRYTFHGEWNYVIHPGPIAQTLRTRQSTSNGPTNSSSGPWSCMATR